MGRSARLAIFLGIAMLEVSGLLITGCALVGLIDPSEQKCRMMRILTGRSLRLIMFGESYFYFSGS